MLETRTHTFSLSARELRKALQDAYGENLRIKTLPENFSLETFGGSGITVSYTLKVEPRAA